MPAGWAAAGVAAAGIAGSIIQGDAAKSAAGTSADAQRYAADQAAAAAKFTPYGVTTGFGSSNFGYDANGNPTASYTLTPELQAIRNRMVAQAGAYDPTQLGQAAQPLFGGANQAFAGANQVLGTANTAFGTGQNLVNLGGNYLAQSPEQARQDYIRNQQALFAGSDEQQLAALKNQQFQTGRIGLATGGTSAGNLAQTNPEMAALYNARARRDLELAANAETAAQQRQAFGASLQGQGIGMFGSGAGLFSSGTNLYGQGAGLLGQIPALTVAGYSPLQTQLGIAGQIENYGQSALDIGAQLGGRSATAGANVGQALLTGGISAARTAQAGNAYSPVGSLLQGVGNSTALNSWFQNTLNKNSTGLSYNPGAGYGTATGYQSWDMSNPELVQTQQTYGI